MNWPDFINGCLEGFGGLLIGWSIVRLYHDKIVRGVHPLPVTFFACWGFWNLFFYPHLDQRFSFAGGCVMVVFNTAWLLQMLYYKLKEWK